MTNTAVVAMQLPKTQGCTYNTIRPARREFSTLYTNSKHGTVLAFSLRWMCSRSQGSRLGHLPRYGMRTAAIIFPYLYPYP